MRLIFLTTMHFPAPSISIGLMLATLWLGSCSRKEDAARAQVKESGLPFSPAALVSAAGEGRTADVRALLDSGIHPDAANAQGRTALLAAAEAGHGQIVRLLVERQSSLISQKEPPLVAAARGGDEEALRVLLDAGASAELAASDGRSALETAAALGNVEAVEVLAARSGQQRADQALLVAAAAARADAVAILIEAGADLFARSPEGRTPFLCACAAGDLAGVRLLAARGAALSAIDSSHRTALDLAKAGGHTPVVQWLKSWRDVSAAACFHQDEEAVSPDARPLAEADLPDAAGSPDSWFKVDLIQPAALPFSLDEFQPDGAALAMPDDSVAVFPADSAITGTPWRITALRPGIPGNAGFTGGLILIRRESEDVEHAVIAGLPGITSEPEALAKHVSGSEWLVHAGDQFTSGGTRWRVTRVHPSGLSIRKEGE